MTRNDLNPFKGVISLVFGFFASKSCRIPNKLLVFTVKSFNNEHEFYLLSYRLRLETLASETKMSEDKLVSML